MDYDEITIVQPQAPLRGSVNADTARKQSSPDCLQVGSAKSPRRLKFRYARYDIRGCIERRSIAQEAFGVFEFSVLPCCHRSVQAVHSVHCHPGGSVSEMKLIGIRFQVVSVFHEAFYRNTRRVVDFPSIFAKGTINMAGFISDLDSLNREKRLVSKSRIRIFCL